MLISVSKFIKPRGGGGGGGGVDSRFAENIPISVRQVLVKRKQRQLGTATVGYSESEPILVF